MRFVTGMILLISFSASAKTVLVKAPEANPIAYQSKIDTQSDFISVIDWYFRIHPSETNKTRLVELLEDAQMKFVSANPKSSTKSFQDIIDLALVDDWKAEHREVFLYASLRLAQLTEDLKERDKFIRIALSHSFKIEPEKDIFPPPLLRRFDEIKGELQTSDLEPMKFRSKWDAVLINGVMCTLESCPSLVISDIPMRVTWLSNQWQTATELRSSKELSREEYQEPSPNKPWIRGSCLKSSVDGFADQDFDAEAYFKDDCKVANKNLELKPMLTTSEGVPLASPSPGHSKTSWLRSPWLWAGVAGAAAVVIWQTNKQGKNDSSTEPSTTYGFRF